MRHLIRRVGLSVVLIVGGGGGLAIGLSATRAAAQLPACTISWNNPAGGNWSTAADWTVTGGGNRVPTTSDDVCITLPGTYTVTLAAGATVNSVTVGNTPANTGDNESLTLASNGTTLSLGSGSTNTIGADGTLNVGDTTNTSTSVLSAPTSATFTNDGNLNTVQGTGGLRYLRADIDNVGTTTIGSSGTVSDGGDGASVFTNNGTFTVSSGGNYTLSGGASFTNDSGSVSNSGTLEQSAGTFTARGGSESGTPVSIVSATLDDDTSAGGGQFLFSGGSTLTGTGANPGISTGQTLTIAATGSVVTLAKSITNDGTLNVGDPILTNTSTSVLTAPTTLTLTNDGTINTVQGFGGLRYLRANIDNVGTTTIGSAHTVSDGGDGASVFTNNGTFTVSSGGNYTLSGGASFTNDGGTVSNGGTLEQSAGTFTARGGSESGTPVSIVSATLDDDTSAGGGQFVFSGASTLTGTGSNPGISSGQTLTVAATGSVVTLAKSITNDGIFNVGDTTNTSTSVLTAPTTLTLTNDGNLNTVQGTGGLRYLRADIDNVGTTTIGSSGTVSDGGDGASVFTNNGTLTVSSGGKYALSGGSSLVARTSGTLTFHIASATTFGSITATGTSVAGTADPIPDGGYVPPVNTEFEVIKDASYSGCFSTIDSGFTADCTNLHFGGVGLVAGSPLVPTTTSLGTASLNPSTFGQSVTFTATVTPSDGNGTVSFTSDGITIANCGSQPLNLVASAWQATCTTSALTGGSDSVGASYSGDNGFGSSNATAITQTVNQATPSVTWTAPASISYGTPLSATQLDATASVPGTFVYSPPSGTVLGAGTNQALSVTFTPTDATDYTTATGGTTLTVSQVTPTVTWATPSAITVGTALSATQLDATASVPGTFVYSPPSGTVLGVGLNQALSVTFTPTDTTDYTTATGGVTLTVNAKAVPTITWATPAAIPVGTALSATQLDATASVPGTFVYSPPSGTVLGVGPQLLSVIFTPTDTTDYATATGGVTLQVNQITPTVTWATPSAITVGTALSATQLDATASVPGTFVYSPPSGTVLGVGLNQALSVIFTPTDTTDYTTAVGSTTLTVNAKAVPTITWATPAAITVGTALSATQLDATASVPGTFVYNPDAGTVLGVGPNQPLAVTFTPTDTTDYTTAVGSTTLTVNAKATPTITWATPAAISYGTALSATQLDATASVPGTFVYTPPSGTVLTAGPEPLAVTFTPTDSADYATATGGVTLQVNQATPTVTWVTPAAITVGTALGATQLDATASVPGTFVYSPPSGTVLGIGTNQALSVIFTPTDTTDYTTAVGSTTLTVNSAIAHTTTTLSVSPNPLTVGQTPTLFATVSAASGTPMGTVTFYDGTKVLGTAPITSIPIPFGGTFLGAELQVSQLSSVYAIGSHSLTASYGGSGSFLPSTSVPDVQTVASPIFADDGEGNYLDIINSTTDVRTAQTFVGGNTCNCEAQHYLALSPDGTRAYVLDPSPSGSTVHVVNTANSQDVASISTPGWAQDLVLSPNGSQLYVADLNNQVTIISTATDSVTGSITGVNVSYFGPQAVSINPSGTELFVVLGNYGVDVINLSTDRVVATVPLPGAEGIAAAPNGSAVYVTNGYLGAGLGAGTVSVLSTATNTITRTYSGMNEAVELAVSPTTGFIYAANVGAYFTGTTAHLTTPYIAVINPANGAVSDINLPAIPNGVAVSPDGTRVYAATNSLSSGGAIYVINAATNATITSVGGMETADTVIPFGAAPVPPVVPPLVVSTKTLPGATQGVPYSTTLSAGGGQSPYSWQLTSGTLPTGLFLNGSTGQIYGTPTAPASASLVFTLTDSEYPPATTTGMLSLNVAAGTTAAPPCPSSPGIGLPTAQGCASGSSTSPTGTATASSTGARGTITVSAQGSGGITVGQYGQEPTGGVPFNSSGAPFDVALSSVNTFTSVTIKDCALNGATSLWWFNPAANGGAGGWQVVAPAVYTPAGRAGFFGTTPACLTVTVSATSSPTLAQLTGTVFDGALPSENVSVSVGGATPYSVSGPVLSGSVTISAGFVSQVQGTVVVAGPHGDPVTIGIHEACVWGACLGTISIVDPASGIDASVPSSISTGDIEADSATAKGEVVFGHGAPYPFSWSVTVTPPSS